jgi:hypothetical protein
LKVTEISSSYDNGRVRNYVAGDVGSVVQMGTVHGGITVTNGPDGESVVQIGGRELSAISPDMLDAERFVEWMGRAKEFLEKMGSCGDLGRRDRDTARELAAEMTRLAAPAGQ